MLSDAVKQAPQLSLLGTGALLFEAPGAFELATQQRIWSLAETAAAWPGIGETAPGVTNLLLRFSQPCRDIDALKQRVLDAWDVALPVPRQGKVVDVPVIYGGEYGRDLPAVAEYAKLSIEQVAKIHSSGLYPVFALGAHPGLAYLGDLDPRIHVPRKKVPILRAEAGTVSIGGMQTGVSCTPGPSGWNNIGRSTARLFDPMQDPPAVLAPGDAIRFVIERVIQ